VQSREEEAYANKYGSFTRRLHEKISNADGSDIFDIEVFLKSDVVDWENIAQKAKNNSSDKVDLRKKLSELRVSRIGDITDKYSSKLNNNSNINIKAARNGVVSIRLEASKSALMEIESESFIWKIFEFDDKIHLALDSATDTHGTYDERDSTYNAQGYRVGHLEYGTPSDAQVNFAGKRWADDDSSQHAAVTVECAACTSDALPGTAYGADVYSADNPANNWDDRNQWFSDNEVAAVNDSWGIGDYYYSRTMQTFDFMMEQACYNYNLTHVVSNGNGTEDGPWTPAKAFNCISVGAIDDQNTGDNLSDDSRYDGTYLNARSQNYTEGKEYPHHKPEVSAVGAQILTPAVIGDLTTSQVSGTSYASPGVAGLVTLLEKFSSYPSIHSTPTLAKAITMASATHEISTDGNDFNRRGTGCIQAEQAMEILRDDYFIFDEFYKSNNDQKYDIYLQEGDELKLVLCWHSNATDNWADNRDAQSDINLDVYVYDPAGDLDFAAVEYDRAWQYMEPSGDGVDVTESGTYTLMVYKSRWDADESYRPFSIAWYRK